MLAPWTFFLPEVLMDVPGCPQPVVVNAIQNAAAQFFRDSKLLKVSLAPINLVAGTGHYVLAAPSTGMTLHGCAKVRVNGKYIDPITRNSLGDEWDTATGLPFAFVQDEPYSIDLIYVPDTSATAGLEIECYWAPAKSGASSGVEQWVAENYLEEIAAGAKARLLMLPGKAWSNPDLGQYFSGKFDQAVASAKLTAAAGVGDARLRTRSYPR